MKACMRDLVWVDVQNGVKCGVAEKEHPKMVWSHQKDEE